MQQEIYISPKVKLDELEIMIKLLKIQDPDLSMIGYKQLAVKVGDIFDVDVNEQDIFLLHEPTIQNDIIDSEIHYESILNYSPSLLILNDYPN